MNAFGEVSLSVAVLLCAVSIFAVIAAVRYRSSTGITVARWTTAGMAWLFGCASLALASLLIKSDFSVTYVAHYTERALPIGYKLAAFWAGQEGSLLLWALLLAVMSTVAVFTLPQKQSIGQSAAVIATLSVVCGFFGLLLLFAADPFAIEKLPQPDGAGLNPALQDLGMIAHPPMLFLGYAGCTIPFALMIGALVTKQRNDQWVISARRWSLVAWLFLTIGIILGARWAYTVLGWGGYWSWDPVENASLLPWLTGTALLHSLMMQQHRGMFRIWNAFLLAITFILCIFGTYITRGGLVDSVHGFAHSMVGTFFLGLLAVVTFSSIALILWRVGCLKSDHKLQHVLGREGAFLAANILLTGIMFVVLIGTIFPAITEAITGTRTTLQSGFYNKVFSPVAMLTVALMASGPLQVYGADAVHRLKRGLIIPGILGLVAAAVAYFNGIHNLWAILCAFVSTAAVMTVITDLLHQIILHSRVENVFTGTPRLLLANHRRYGAQLSHVGVILMLIGITGSGLFARKEMMAVSVGTPIDTIAGRLSLYKVAETRGPNYSATEATILFTAATGDVRTFKPQRRVYDRFEDETVSIVAIESNWQQDLYVSFLGAEPDGNTVALQVMINPLVSWLWIGGIVLAIGGTICLIPNFKFSVERREVKASDSLAACGFADPRLPIREAASGNAPALTAILSSPMPRRTP